jgi:late competence protein required for DNA uptake (superfamily II DNA/RNA helicase)
MTRGKDLDGQKVICFQSYECERCSARAGDEFALYSRGGRLYCRACYEDGDQAEAGQTPPAEGPHAEGR